MTTTEQRLADALRVCAEYLAAFFEEGSDHPAIAAADEALAAYDAHQAQDVAAGAWWFAADHGDVYAVGMGDKQIATGMAREHAARIVACVNACAGMTTAEVLEFGMGRGGQRQCVSQ
jgi:hypothetical protein